MKNYPKSQKGFIQIPILIAIIVGVLVIGGGSYFGYTQFKNYQVQQAEKERQIQELAEAQQEILEKSQQEIEKLKEEVTEEQAAFQQRISGMEEKIKESSQKLEITAIELESYLSGVVKISCKEGEGSGSLWNIPEQGYRILTNQHVIEGESGACSLDITKTNNRAYGWYNVLLNEQYRWNYVADVVTVKLEINKLLNDAIVSMTSKQNESTPISELNYKISNLRKCPPNMSLGSPVVLIGYPVFAERVDYYEGEKVVSSFRTVTNGIISAHDMSFSLIRSELPHSNYFVSAKIDSGNSGGIALSKDESGLCLLGIPTWLSIGNYETQGIVQNIHNIIYTE